MLKVGSKRRRTTQEVKADKRAKLEREEEIAAKFEQLEQLRLQIARMPQQSE